MCGYEIVIGFFRVDFRSYRIEFSIGLEVVYEVFVFGLLLGRNEGCLDSFCIFFNFLDRGIFLVVFSNYFLIRFYEEKGK